MKKSKILVVGLIGLLMAGGIVFIGCKDDRSCPRGGDCFRPSAGGWTEYCTNDNCAVSKAFNAAGGGAPPHCFYSIQAEIGAGIVYS